MSNEIQSSVTLKASKNGASVSVTATDTLDMSGNNMVQQPQSIATSATAIDLGNISGAPKKLLIVNLDPTNYVEIDSANTFDKFPQKILPGGDVILLSPQTGTIYGKANTAAVLINIVAVQA